MFLTIHVHTYIHRMKMRLQEIWSETDVKHCAETKNIYSQNLLTQCVKEPKI